MEVTLFTGFNQPQENKPLIDILNDIKNGTFRADIDNIRSLIASGETEKANKLKQKLPAFTPSATFKGGRTAELLHQYSGYVHLDFDKLSPEQFNKAFHEITQIPYTFACFRSPSGNGLKVFIEVLTESEHHASTYKQVQQYYENKLNILCDSKCKDITRLCFVSDDSDTYINEYSQRFNALIDNKITHENQVSLQTSDYLPIFNDCITFTEKKEQFYQGNRNNFIYQLACNCNRKGIPEYLTSEFINNNFNYPVKEIQSAVKSAYHHHVEEFAINNNSTSHDITNFKTEHPIDDIEEDYLSQTPFIPEEVYNTLPEILKVGASVFKDKRERDVFLTGAISILSGCLPNVKGVYAQQTVYPNLFSFVIAPAASGKGALKYAKSLADKYHESLLNNSKALLHQYEIDMINYRISLKTRKKGSCEMEPPQQPPFKIVFIPANSSYAKILTHLQDNEGFGIICETEADTMGNVLKQEWGGYSELLRKAFHHERISSSKKTNNEYIEVNEPRLSVALSGTPNQITSLIASSEDGLFSRFIFYTYKNEQLWYDVSPNSNTINLNDYFNNLSDVVFQCVTFCSKQQTTIELTSEQWDKLNNTCKAWLEDIVIFSGDESGSIVKRLGLILYRIAMILSTLRKFESHSNSSSFTCTDLDFENALSLANVYLKHSILMFHNLPKQNVQTQFVKGEKQRKFFDALPSEFKRNEAIQLAEKFKISKRTMDNFLKKLTGKYLTQPEYGYYRKI